VPRLRTLLHGRRFILDWLSAFPSKDIDSVRKRSAKICQQHLINEILRFFALEFALNLIRENATPIQRGFHSRFLNRI
jgi:hypothetical protein